MKRLLLLLALVALPSCAPLAPLVFPKVATVPPTQKLPIDGLWLMQSITTHSTSYGTRTTPSAGMAILRVDSGRMWVHESSHPNAVGNVFAKEIRQIAPNKYAAQTVRASTAGVFFTTVVGVIFVPAEIEVRSGSLLVVRTAPAPGSDYSVEIAYQKLKLDDEAWFSAQLASDHILSQAPAPRPAPLASISPSALKAKVQNLGGASWALVVGINAYRHADRLNYAVADARAVAAALRGLGFQNVRVLLDDDATRANIERAIYIDFKEKMGRDDRLFVFFAGHGITVDLPRGGEEGYLIPVDGDPRRPEVTAIAMDEIRKMGRRVGARHIFFAIDSCFSGFAISRDIRPEAVSDQRIAAALEEPVVQVLTAGRKGQKAVEEEGHGVFTRRLLDGLRGLADREGRGFVTATELAAWLGPRVIRDSGGRQHPQYSALDGEGDFVFLLPKADR